MTTSTTGSGTTTFGAPEPGRLVLGAVRIEWDAAVADPIVADLARPGWFRTACVIRYWYGTFPHPFEIPAGFSFDGASIPWFARLLFAKYDWHLLAALPHDYVCDHPELLPRPIGDGIFISVLLALADSCANGQRRWWKQVEAWAMYLAVWSWTVWQAMQHGVRVNVSNQTDGLSSG